MFEYQNGQFIKLIYEVFNNTIQGLGFKFQEENKKLLYARKGDVQLIFRLETGYKFRLFSLEIRLLGELGERATSKPYYRNLAVSTIAKFTDPDYKISSEITSTEDELRKVMETQKHSLLKYCNEMLHGDITRWPRIVDLIIEETGFVG